MGKLQVIYATLHWWVHQNRALNLKVSVLLLSYLLLELNSMLLASK